MPRQVRNVPLREHRPRTAKAKASNEIKKYFKPKRTLQDIPEDLEVKEPKKIALNDDNNNSIDKILPFDQNNSNGVKTSIKLSEVKQMKAKEVNLLKLAQKQSAMQKGLLDEPFIRDDVVVAHSTPIKIEQCSKENTPQSDYGFDGLHTDDSTDHEDEQFNVPYWSLETNRLAIITEQRNVSVKTVDLFFDAKPQTVNSKEIFKNTSPILRRRSTAVWNTPPRYSMLPKY